MKSLLSFLSLLPLAFCLLQGSGCHPIEQPPASNYPVEDSLKVLTALPGTIEESSGVIYLGNHLWTHNDSGDAPRLYEISPTKDQLFRSVWINGAENRDWEDIAQDERYVYIGDFGNNNGNRRDLVVYKVSRDSLLKKENYVVDSEQIHFYYPDQVDFNPGAYHHNYDCEAMISVGDSLFLFSKNHVDRKCRLYALPKTPGNYAARPVDEFDTDGPITAAGYDPEHGVVALLGYNTVDMLLARTFDPFVWLFYQYPGRDFFRGKKTRVNISKIRQMEGICYYRDGKYILSCESGDEAVGTLYLWDAWKWIGENYRLEN